MNLTKEQIEKINQCMDCRRLFNATRIVTEKMRKKLMEAKQTGKFGWDDKENLNNIDEKISKLTLGNVEGEDIIDLMNYLTFLYAHLFLIHAKKEDDIELNKKIEFDS